MRRISPFALLFAASLLTGCGGEQGPVPSYAGDGGAMAVGDGGKMQSERDAVNQAERVEQSVTDPSRNPRSRR